MTGHKGKCNCLVLLRKRLNEDNARSFKWGDTSMGRGLEWPVSWKRQGGKGIAAQLSWILTLRRLSWFLSVFHFSLSYALRGTAFTTHACHRDAQSKSMGANKHGQSPLILWAKIPLSSLWIVYVEYVNRVRQKQQVWWYSCTKLKC